MILIGLRAIYLFKYDWQEMNDFILQNFEVCVDEKIIIITPKMII